MCDLYPGPLILGNSFRDAGMKRLREHILDCFGTCMRTCVHHTNTGISKNQWAPIQTLTVMVTSQMQRLHNTASFRLHGIVKRHRNTMRLGLARNNCEAKTSSKSAKSRP